MKVLRLHAAGDVRLHDEPAPDPGPGEELVRVTAVGLCGSDLHWFADGRVGEMRLERPLILGHEVGGVIASGPRAGMRVAIDPADPCERCAACLAGHTNLCTDMRFCGLPSCEGSLRESMAWPARLLVPVPDAIPDDEVPLLESLGIALHAVALGHVRPGMAVGVYGCGPIGLLLIALLRARGATRIVATEPLPHRRAAALAMGATVALDVDPDGISRVAMDEPVDVAFEAAGEDAAIATGVGAIGPGGRVVLVGIPGSDAVTFASGVARRKGLTFVVSRRMQAHHLAQATNLVAVGVVPLAPLVTARYPMTEAPAAFAALVRRDGLKIVVRPNA